MIKVYSSIYNKDWNITSDMLEEYENDIPVCKLHNIKGEDKVYETHNIMGCECECENCKYFEEEEVNK